jgi:hypothetical protein
MTHRTELEPQLQGDHDVTLEQLLEHVRHWQADTLAAVESLRASRRQIEEHSSRLENPQAALQLADFFSDFFLRVAADLDGVLESLAAGPAPEHVTALKSVAARAAAEERRAVVFRDRWVNKPLPYEEMRPLLDRVSAAARDQLIDYRNLTHACARLGGLIQKANPAAEQPDSEGRELDRRQLFTRFIPRRDDAGGER